MTEQKKEELKEKNLQRRKKAQRDNGKINGKSNNQRPEKALSKETLDRYNYISELLISGYSRREAKNEVIKKYDIKDDAAMKLVNKAVEYYRFQDMKERDSMCQLLLGRYDELYSAAAGKEEFAAANKALEMIAKLFNLFDNKVDINLKADVQFDFGNSEEQEEEK